MRKFQLQKTNYFILPGLKGAGIFQVYRSGDHHVIMNCICKHFNITESDILKRSRKRPMISYRQITIYLLRKYTGLSLKSIGEIFKMDHTSIMHSCTVVKTMLTQKCDIQDWVTSIEPKLI